MEMGKVIYDTICTVLDKMGLSYKKVEEDLVVLFGHRGEDMSHELLIAVNTEQEVIQLFEKLPISVDVEKANEFAAAVCYANEKLLIGNFVYGMGDTIRYDISQMYTGCLIGEETIKRMIMALALSVEKYDDKFMALNKGYIKADAFKDN